MRTFAYNSLGRISIFMASKAEADEDYKKKLEKAIKFFERAAQDAPELSKSSKFCLPFYRSFYSIIFKRQQAKGEVYKYLAEAKAAIGSSDSKEMLFEAVENLAEALKPVNCIILKILY